jgi:hypothetical protein
MTDRVGCGERPGLEANHSWRSATIGSQGGKDARDQGDGRQYGGDGGEGDGIVGGTHTSPC